MLRLDVTEEDMEREHRSTTRDTFSLLKTFAFIFTHKEKLFLQETTKAKESSPGSASWIEVAAEEKPLKLPLLFFIFGQEKH